MTGPRTAAGQLIASHLVGGRPVPGEEIALRIDQTLCQDATGTLVMQELEALGLYRALAPAAEPRLTVHNATRDEDYPVTHRLSPRRREAVLAGGAVPALRHAGR
ncbi:hypothetical protein ACWEO1_20275 [Kitasatospora cineracea]